MAHKILTGRLVVFDFLVLKWHLDGAQGDHANETCEIDARRVAIGCPEDSGSGL